VPPEDRNLIAETYVEVTNILNFVNSSCALVGLTITYDIMHGTYNIKNRLHNFRNRSALQMLPTAKHILNPH
jgi:hypothetical protein